MIVRLYNHGYFELLLNRYIVVSSHAYAEMVAGYLTSASIETTLCRVQRGQNACAQARTLKNLGESRDTSFLHCAANARGHSMSTFNLHTHVGRTIESTQFRAVRSAAILTSHVQGQGLTCTRGWCATPWAARCGWYSTAPCIVGCQDECRGCHFQVAMQPEEKLL